jgi:hypothetical protein
MSRHALVNDYLFLRISYTDCPSDQFDTIGSALSTVKPLAPAQVTTKRPRKTHYELYREVVRQANATRKQSDQESDVLLPPAQSSMFLNHLPSPNSRISSLVSAHAPVLRRVASARVDEASRQPSRILSRSRTISTPLPPVPTRSNTGSSQGRVNKIKQELLRLGQASPAKLSPRLNSPKSASIGSTADAILAAMTETKGRASSPNSRDAPGSIEPSAGNHRGQ